jgi:hypothetical protein
VKYDFSCCEEAGLRYELHLPESTASSYKNFSPS